MDCSFSEVGSEMVDNISCNMAGSSRVNQATSEVYRPPDRGLGALFCQSLGVPTGRQISLPLGPAGAYTAGSLSASFVLLLSALLQWHVRTFHGVSRGGGGCCLPSGFGHLGIIPHPPPIPFP